MKQDTNKTILWRSYTFQRRKSYLKLWELALLVLIPASCGFIKLIKSIVTMWIMFNCWNYMVVLMNRITGRQRMENKIKQKKMKDQMMGSI